jgi:hypothetical protein
MSMVFTVALYSLWRAWGRQVVCGLAAGIPAATMIGYPRVRDVHEDEGRLVVGLGGVVVTVTDAHPRVLTIALPSAQRPAELFRSRREVLLE